MRTPIQSGRWNNIFSAKAVPITATNRKIKKFIDNKIYIVLLLVYLMCHSSLNLNMNKETWMRGKFKNDKASKRMNVKISFKKKKKKRVNFIVLPSGISAHMTANSASNHRQYFTYFGYSNLHNSERCLPVEICKQILSLIRY